MIFSQASQFVSLIMRPIVLENPEWVIGERTQTWFLTQKPAPG